MTPVFFVIALGALPLILLLLWRFPRLEDAGGGTGDVSVVIPARNEARNLPRLLRSLVQQSVMPREIIVVDDNSEDETARVAAALGARVLSGRPLPGGWLGKPWACWQGALSASGRVLVFLDADTRLDPTAIQRLTASVSGQGGLVSLWPYHHMERPYERLGLLFHMIVMASVEVFSVLGARLRSPGAFGPCIACLREDYFAVGGHHAVRGEILEDMALGRRFVEAGRRVRLYAGRGVVSFRMYPDGVGALIRGFSKNLGSGAAAASSFVVALCLLWITGASIAAFFAAASLFSGCCRELWYPLAGLYVLEFYAVARRLGNYGLVTALSYPALLLFFGAVMLYSLVLTFVLGRVSWKGREIDLEK